MSTKTAPPKIPHGSPSTYSNYECRCPACKAAKSRENRAYYERQKKQQEAQQQ